MALTITKTGDWNIIAGNVRMVNVQVAFDSSYPTGGEALAATDIGLRTVLYMAVQPKSGFSFEYDYTNSKLQAFSQGVAHATGGAVTMDDYAATAGPGVSASISMSFETGAGAVTHRWGPMKEIASTDDLSTLTGVRVFAVGL